MFSNARIVGLRRTVSAALLLAVLGAAAANAQIDSDSSVDVPGVPVETFTQIHADTASTLNIPLDSSQVAVRSPAQAEIDRFRNDDDFDYGASYKEPESLIEIIMRTISRWFREFLGDSESEFWEIVGYVILVVTVIFVAMKLYGKEVTRLFFKSKKERDADAALANEDVHGIDYQSQIALAVTRGDYRLAVRLHYLRTLRDLSESGAITWRRNKTDHDYKRDLVGNPMQSDFERAAMLFEYVWYGDFPVDRSGYDRISAVIDRVTKPRVAEHLAVEARR